MNAEPTWRPATASDLACIDGRCDHRQCRADQATAREFDGGDQR